MKYRKHEGLEVSEIGMGCYPLSGSYGSVNKTHYKEVLQHAHDLGINFFDTAATYGKEAERILGEAVKPFREEVHISTKIGMGEGGKPNLSYEHIHSMCNRSLKRLQTEYIDVYLLHYDNPLQPIDEALAALDDLKQEGKILHYGVSHISSQRVPLFLEKGDVSFGFVELSAVNREQRKELLPLYRDHGVGGIAFSITGRGLLTGKYENKSNLESGDIRNIDSLFHYSRFESALRIVEKMRDLGRKYEKTPVQVAIQWVLSQPGIICGLTSTTSIDHLEENVGGSGWQLSEPDLRALESHLTREDEILNKEEPDLIRELLQSELPTDLSQCFVDLMYVIEIAVRQKMIAEKKVLPTFHKLWKLWKSKEKVDPSNLKEIQQELKRLILD